MSDAVLTTLLAGGFSVLVALLEMTRRQNNRDHNTNAVKLDVLAVQQDEARRTLDRVEDKIDTHINDHAKGNL